MAAVPTDAKGVIQACPKCGQKNRIPFERLGQAGTCGKCQADIPPLATPLDISSDGAFQGLISRSIQPVLVDFWAPWCGPCRMVAPEMEKVAASSAGRIVVAKVNTEALPELAGRYGVMSIPTMAVFAGGREVSRTAGAMPAAAIQQFVMQAMGAGAGR